jgi:hypothetical protein
MNISSVYFNGATGEWATIIPPQQSQPADTLPDLPLYRQYGLGGSLPGPPTESHNDMRVERY